MTKGQNEVEKVKKGQISENVANCLKHMENRYFIEKTCFNYFLKFFLSIHSKELWTCKFSEIQCMKFYKSNYFTMESEKVIKSWFRAVISMKY